jgi:hypothetical protein
MDGIRTVDDLIKAKNLTEKELEMFDDLIREARERERKSNELSKQTRANLEKLSGDLTTIVEKTSQLGQSIKQLLDQMEALHLRSMPEGKFYRE